ncbi:MAG: redoxin domain-containing protein [Chloroflexi bacterium]|nr:redoxin domain-containing protein [Chloroflexota bacterium]
MGSIFKISAVVVAAGILITAVCWPTGSLGTGSKAPDFQGIADWINSRPLTMEELRGRVVLVDFWTYTCVNCIRTMPYLKDWHAKYASHGLVIVGVHSPEFEFEKLTENVTENARDFGLEYPIAQDNGFQTWRAYRNRFWPAKYLMDAEGEIRYTHFGEGAYGETERRIRGLLEDAGADLSGVPEGLQAEASRITALASPNRVTRELYGGTKRNRQPGGNYVAQIQYYQGGTRVIEFQDPGSHQNHKFYLQGVWFNDVEAVRHARQTENYEDYIALKFTGTSVNAVISPEKAASFEVQVTLDGRPLDPSEAGADLIAADGRSYFTVNGGRLYQVVALPEYGEHELKLSSNSDDFALFAFTFGANSQGP